MQCGEVFVFGLHFEPSPGNPYLIGVLEYSCENRDDREPSGSGVPFSIITVTTIKVNDVEQPRHLSPRSDFWSSQCFVNGGNTHVGRLVRKESCLVGECFGVCCNLLHY